MQHGLDATGLPSPGTIIAGRYKLRQILGRGSFGQVYYAKDLKFEPSRAVALKLLLPQYTTEEQAREELKREAGVLARFNHPNILRIIDFEINEQLAYIVTELADGGSLANKLRFNTTESAGRLSFGEISYYLEQIAAGLDQAHSQGLIHRDIKPHNILLDQHNRPMIADFGLAAILSASASSALIDTKRSGTALYMAPEQWKGQAGRASDIYAFGVVLYQMITGQPPFRGNELELMGQHLNTPVPKLAYRAPGLDYPPELDEIIAAAMAKNPKERPKLASDLARLFKEAVETPDLDTSEKTRVLTNSAAPDQPLATLPITPIEEKESTTKNRKLRAQLNLETSALPGSSNQKSGLSCKLVAEIGMAVVSLGLMGTILLVALGSNFALNSATPTPLPVITPSPGTTPTLETAPNLLPTASATAVTTATPTATAAPTATPGPVLVTFALITTGQNTPDTNGAVEQKTQFISGQEVFLALTYGQGRAELDQLEITLINNGQAQSPKTVTLDKTDGITIVSLGKLGKGDYKVEVRYNGKLLEGIPTPEFSVTSPSPTPPLGLPPTPSRAPVPTTPPPPLPPTPVSKTPTSRPGN